MVLGAPMERVSADKFEQALKREFPRGIAGAEGRLTVSEWADSKEVLARYFYDPEKIFLGYRGGKPIGVGDDRHVLTVAGSRAGKGVSLMIPNLLLYQGSVLAIDPKGELAAITLRARAAQGQRCYALDPMGVSGHTSCFNPRSNLIWRPKRWSTTWRKSPRRSSSRTSAIRTGVKTRAGSSRPSFSMSCT